jgi:hypothetical protein
MNSLSDFSFFSCAFVLADHMASSSHTVSTYLQLLLGDGDTGPTLFCHWQQHRLIFLSAFQVYVQRDNRNAY